YSNLSIALGLGRTSSSHADTKQTKKIISPRLSFMWQRNFYLFQPFFIQAFHNKLILFEYYHLSPFGKTPGNLQYKTRYSFGFSLFFFKIIFILNFSHSIKIL